MTNAASIKAETPVWFITGCSTGFGRELTRAVLEKGWRVVTTARKPEQIADLVAGHEDRALALALDVTDPRQIADSVRQAESRFGRIDVLVNNAGYGYLAAVEEGEDAALRAMFETNFFGLAAMTRAVLPGMRQRRHGHIVNISSIGGLMGNSGSGYYQASKFAVEGLSEALAKEVEPLGIKVLIVEPAGFRTNWAGASIKQSKEQIADYAETATKRQQTIRGSSGRQNGDPVRAAAIIIKTVMAENPPLRLLLGKAAFEMIPPKIESMLAEFNAWRETTLSADYPKNEV